MFFKMVRLKYIYSQYYQMNVFNLISLLFFFLLFDDVKQLYANPACMKYKDGIAEVQKHETTKLVHYCFLSFAPAMENTRHPCSS